VKNNSRFYYSFLLAIPVFFAGWYFLSLKHLGPLRLLPYYGPKQALKINDTTYHSVPGFTFVDQYNEEVSEKTVKNKIYVTEFFFTTCQSICPVMNTNLERVYVTHKNDKDFLILSHTVDPGNDSVPVLKQYAESRGVTNKNWLFVTGSKKDLYAIARKGYLLDAAEGNGDEEDFIHTQNFALVDKNRNIRGYYDGTDSLEVERLLREIELLKKEYE
jgi:protein SCO1/2